MTILHNDPLGGDDDLIVLSARIPRKFHAMIGQIAKKKMRSRGDIARTILVAHLTGMTASTLLAL